MSLLGGNTHRSMALSSSFKLTLREVAVISSLQEDCSVADVDDDFEGQKVGCLPELLQDDGNS